MPWIENVAASDIPIGFHHNAGPNSMLISIVAWPGHLGFLPLQPVLGSSDHFSRFFKKVENDVK